MRLLRLCHREMALEAIDVRRCDGFSIDAALFVPISHESNCSVQQACLRPAAKVLSAK